LNESTADRTMIATANSVMPQRLRRALLALALGAAAALTGCATTSSPPDAAARQALAPTGTLRVAVYLGSPTSLVIDPKTGEKAGVSVDLGRELAARLGVPMQLVEHKLVAEVINALRGGAADFTVTNASAERAKIVDFTDPIVDLELGYLVLPGSPIGAIAEVDRTGMRIGVSQGSSSQGALTKAYQNAKVVGATSLAAAAGMLQRRELDAFATNKAVLFQMTDTLPGARVLEGRWGTEHLAIAVPRGRGAGAEYLRRFAVEMKSGGQLRAAAARAGLRGTAEVGAQ
jgi:polar amino acid transport system substrate-binding protein